MPAVQAPDLVASFLHGVLAGGGAGRLLSAPTAQPKEIEIVDGRRRLRLWLYLWTITPGGRAHLRGEVRVQITGLSPPLAGNAGGPTLLMGFDPTLGAFAGFDVARHVNFSRKSPSIQSQRRCLEDALRFGLGFHHKTKNDEIVVGVRPDLLMFYASNASSLHRAHPSHLPLLAQAASGERMDRAAIKRLPPRVRKLVLAARAARTATRDIVQTEAVTAAFDATEKVAASARGQGFTSSAALRKAIERHAMTRAEAYMRERGFDVTDTSSTRPYDLEVRKGNTIHWVEVKGTTTDGETVMLTRNEVRWARRHRPQMVLFIVQRINVKGQGSDVKAEGGHEHVIWPWDVTEGTLDPLSYTYRPR